MGELGLIIAGGGVILWLLILGRLQWLFWVLLASMVIGDRRLHFATGEYTFNLVPFTLLLGLLTFLTARQLFDTLDRWEGVALGGLVISLPIGLFFGVPLDRAVMWLVPLVSVFLTKHLAVLFVRDAAEVRTAVYIFLAVCALISFGTLLSVFQINLGGLIQGPMYYGEEAASHSGFWGFNAIISIVIIALLFVASLPVSLWWRLLFGLLPVLAVLYSSKRAAYVSLGLVLLFLLMKVREGEPWVERMRRFSLAFVVVVLTFLFVPETTLDRFEGVGDQMTGMMVETDQDLYTYINLGWRDVRVERFLYGWQVFRSSILVGGGAGFAIFLHNGIVEIFANMGLLLGLPLLLLFLVRIGQSWRAGGGSRIWAGALAIFFLSPFMFEAVINRPEFMAFGSFFYAMMMVTRPKPPDERPRRVAAPVRRLAHA